jgi:hypothetical protein
MAREKPDSKTASRTRTDGRKSLLVYLQPDVIKQLKKAALDQETTAYEITEVALREWLVSHRKRRVG